MDSNEMNRIIATNVFKMCLHEYRFQDESELIAANRKSFLDEYGIEAPDTWTGDLSDLWGDHRTKICIFCGGRFWGYLSRAPIPQYDKDAEQAVKLVDKICSIKSGPDENFVDFFLSKEGGWWICCFCETKDDRKYGGANRTRQWESHSETAPKAIALAACKMIEDGFTFPEQ